MSTVNTVSSNPAVSGASSYSAASPSGSSNETAELENLLQDVMQLLQNSDGGGQSSGTGAPSSGAPSTNASSAGAPSTGAPATSSAPASTGSQSPAMNSESASGSLAGYMGTNGNSSLNMNDMYQLSQGQAAGGKGQAPSPEVQQAAQYMMSNPSQYNKLETSDVAGADGKASMADFQNNAQGLN